MSQAGALNSGGGGGTGVQTLTGNTGGAVGPTANNINVVGSGAITVTGNPGTSTLTIASSGGTPGLVFVQSQSASTSASIAFTNLTSFDVYFITITGCGPTSNGQDFIMQVSQNNGVSYLTTGYANGLNYSAYNTSTLSNANSTSDAPIATAVVDDTISASFHVYNADLGAPLQIQGFSTWQTGGAVVNTGYFNGQTPAGITAIQFLFTGGVTINAGTFTLYGLST